VRANVLDEREKHAERGTKQLAALETALAAREAQVGGLGWSAVY
jgi:hypothetical protein